MPSSFQASSRGSKKNENYQKLKTWFNLYLEHKAISIKNAGLSYQSGQPNYYRLYINSINKILQSKGIKSNRQSYLKISATFYNKTSKKFYGRTYNSLPIPLISNQQNIQGLETTQPINLYFYSSLPKTSENLLIIEVMLLELEGSLKKNEIPIGWTELEIYTQYVHQGPSQEPHQKLQKNLVPTQFKTTPFYEGSSRSLLSLASNQIPKKQIGSTLSWKLIDCSELRTIAHLFDEGILCGNDDILPGVEGQRLLNSLSEQNEIPESKPTFKLIVEQIHLKLPIALEAALIKFGQIYRITTYNLGTDQVQRLTDITIRDRKFIAIFHNTWTAVNTKGYENGTSLLPYNQALGEYYYDGSFSLDSIFLDDMGIICFQIEYLLSMPLPGNREEVIKTVIGWCPVFLTPENIASGLIPIMETLISGPGKSLNGEKLFEWELGPKETLEISCLLKFNPLSLNSELGNTLSTMISLDEMDEAAQMLAIITEQQKKMQEMEEAHRFALAQVQQQAKIQAQQAKSQTQQAKSQIQQVKFQTQQAKPYPTSNFQTNLKVPPTNDFDDLPPMLNLQKDFSFQPNYQGTPQIMYLPTNNTHGNEDVLKLIEAYKKEAEITKLEMQVIKMTLNELQSKNKEKEIKETLDKDIMLTGGTLKMATSASNNSPGGKGLTSTQNMFQSTRAQFHKQAFSSGDMTLLLQAGIKGLLDRVDFINDSMEFTLEKCIRNEMTSLLKASKFLIQFLAIKPGSIAHFHDNYNPDDPGNPEGYQFPRKVYFTFNFFNFMVKKTEPIVLEPLIQQSISTIQEQKIPFYLIKEGYLKNSTQNKEPLYQYDIDPSLDQNQTYQYIEFIKYLWKKSLNIDIWDAESLMLFGSVKIPLREMIRNGKPQVGIIKEFNIIEPAFMRIKGGLQMSMKNIGYEPLKTIKTDITDITKASLLAKSSNLMSQSSKKKIVSRNPLNLTEEIKQLSLTSPLSMEELNDPDIRKRERINRYKIAVVESGILVNDNQIPDDNRLLNTIKSSEDLTQTKGTKYLREVTNFRDTKKQICLKNVVNQKYDNEKHINVSFGKAEIFSLEIMNSDYSDGTYLIVINDPDLKYLNNPECEVIYTPEEWKFWIEKKGFNRPSQWNIINKDINNPNTYNIFLRKGEKCEVLFKFMTLRRIKDESNAEELTRIDEEEIKHGYINSRSINVNISHMKGKLLTGLKINIEPHPSIVDHTFRFFEQENRYVMLNLPALYYQSAPPLNRTKLILSYDNATYNWVNDKEVAIEMKVPIGGSVTRFNLLAYEDMFFGELSGNWGIEVHSCTGIDLEVKLGQITSTILAIPLEISRLVKMYISHPSIGYFPSPYNKPFMLASESLGESKSNPVNSITLNIRTFNPNIQKVLINCVDVNSGEKVHSWIVKIIGAQPLITRIIEINYRLGMEPFQKFVYHNRSTKLALFDFISSNPQILQIVDKSVSINPENSADIRIKLGKCENSDIDEVYVFGSDTQEKIFDCILFKIRYSN